MIKLRAIAGILACIACHMAVGTPQVFEVTLSAKQQETLRDKLIPVLEIAEEELLSWVPIRSGGIYFVDCPNCNYGTQDRGRFKWSPEQPYQITCTGCGEIYPGNSKYPENGNRKVEGRVTHVFDFHQSAEREKPYYFSSHVDYWRRLYLEECALELARMYVVTGDERYAHRAALILTRFAEAYPDWVLKYDYPFADVILGPDDGGVLRGVALTRTSKRSWWPECWICPNTLIGHCNNSWV